MLSACSWEEMLLSSTGGGDFHTLLALGASRGGCRQPVWGDSPAWLVVRHAWGSRTGDLVHPAQGISKGWAASAVTKGALAVECCIMGGLPYTVPKVSFGSPYFCIFTLNLEPPRSLPTPSKLCLATWMGVKIS